MKHYAKTQRGFTLIEMSIVLVIIGLIIGGILKGQELIESSRQKNTISQIDRVKAGITTFIDRFKSYPGDYGRATTNLAAQLGNGNENGNVGAINADVAGLVVGANLLANENTQFFTHLIAADLLGGGTLVATGGTAIACFSGNCATPSPHPASAYPQTGLSINYGTHQGTAANTGSSRQTHWIILSRWAAAGAFPATSGGAALSPERSFQLDSKYDDGIAWEGSIRTITTVAACGGTATTYTATTTTVDCNLVFDAE
jgi:prepilin-type N-terminal cleavage/methylation domain-containing protein